MKRILIICAVLFCAAGANAQLSLNGYAGYTFRDKINFNNAYAYYNAAFQWGVGMEYRLQHTQQSVELRYLRMDSQVPVYKKNNEQLNPNNTKTAVNYILIGGNNYFGDPHAKAQPFFGLALGMGILEGNGSSVNKFAWDTKLGVKIHTNSIASIKLFAYLQSVISTFGNDYWVDYWGNIYAVPDYKTLLQFGLGGAISLDFKGKK